MTGSGISSVEPLRGHPTLRMLVLGAVQDGDVSPLETLPELVAVGRGSGLVGEPPFPDLRELPPDHPFRMEFRRAVYG